VRANPYRVTDVRAERGRSWTLTLEPNGRPRLEFSPGQFAWLTLRASPFQAREHPFSIASSAAPDRPLEFTIRELGDFTRTIGATRPGETAYVDGPYGAFTVDRHPGAGSFLFVAGGVGIAPIMSMLRTLADRGDRRPLRLVYGNDRWEDVLFPEELGTLSERVDLQVTHVLLEPPADWTGERGLITKEVLSRVVREARAGMVCFLCGPEPMTDSVQRALQELGVRSLQIHVELFDMA
jgi:predicted ferric reductase